ncbi:MAG: helix-turn-helix transcriptional regulator [Campylobacterota bacterium]|nr:helix-turn-helix transcriptional regulator [Campylobacterota bacterium]
MQIEELNKRTDEVHNIVSANVIKYRQLKNYSQLQLALDIGLTGNAFIARAEKRVKNAHFNIEHIVKISAILNVNIDKFFNTNTVG